MPRSQPNEDIIKIIDEYSPIFYECYASALRSLNRMLDSDPQPFNEGTKAGMLHDAMVNQLKWKLFEDKRTAWNDDYGTIILTIDGKLLVRFNKLDKNGNTQQNDSERRKQFIQLTLDLHFDDSVKPMVPAETAIEVCYLPNEGWTEFISISTICPSEHWTLPMNLEAMAKYLKERDQQEGSEDAQTG